MLRSVCYLSVCNKQIPHIRMSRRNLCHVFSKKTFQAMHGLARQCRHGVFAMLEKKNVQVNEGFTGHWTGVAL